MDTSFVPSLEYLCSVKIVKLMLKDPGDLRWRYGKEEYNRFKSKVIENISKLLTPGILRKKLEYLVAPLLNELVNWMEFHENALGGVWENDYGVNRPVLNHLRNTIQQYWRQDGTVDTEKPGKMLAINKDTNPVNRFILACHFCMFEDVVALWNGLFKIEKAFLRHKEVSENPVSDVIIKQWTEWLEGSTSKDWVSFVAWALERPLWKSNIYILKKMLETVSPMARDEYLLKATSGEGVNAGVMRYVLSRLPEDKQEVIFRENPFEVFKCLLSWPLRNNFIDYVDKLWPHITPDTFNNILNVFLDMIRHEKRDSTENIMIVKSFWAQSPERYKNHAFQDEVNAKAIKFILDHDFAKQFDTDDFEEIFDPTEDLKMPHELYHYFMNNINIDF